MTVALLVLAIFLCIKTVSYLLRWYEVSGSGAVPPASGVGAQLARIGAGIPPFLWEVACTLITYAVWLVESPLRLVFRPFLTTEKTAGRSASRTGQPVILVHGFFMTPWSLWFLYWGLRRAGCGPVYLLDYRPALGEIDGFVSQLAALIDGLGPGGSVDLVGHSMGGLIAARYMGSHPDRVRRLVTIGTPFHGTRLWAMSVGRSLPQMRPGCDFLTATRSALAGRMDRVTCVYSRFDQIILPYQSSRLEGAHNVVLDGLGHNALLLSRGVLKAVGSGLLENNGGAPIETDGAPRV